jgi:hypothetical protein
MTMVSSSLSLHGLGESPVPASSIVVSLSPSPSWSIYVSFSGYIIAIMVPIIAIMYSKNYIGSYYCVVMFSNNGLGFYCYEKCFQK